jgi:hypothetical protein
MGICEVGAIERVAGCGDSNELLIGRRLAPDLRKVVALVIGIYLLVDGIV